MQNTSLTGLQNNNIRELNNGSFKREIVKKKKKKKDK